eukprot:XP_024440548.1 uncharacterized protein LOC18105075 isoform X4 [Populus trichocarpa]
MAAPSELVGGNQNDQAAQPSASNQNNQLVQLSADKNKKRKKREADKKFRDGKKQKTEDMLKQNEKLKADNAELEKKLAYTNGKLEQLKEDMEQTRETSRIQKQMVDTQYNIINMLRQHLQLPFEMNEFDTGATGPRIHHPPEGPAIEESSGLPQSSPLQGLAHLPFGMTQESILGTQEAWLPVHHPPAFQPGTTMGSGRPGH